MCVHFKALQNALIDQPKAPNRQGDGIEVGLEAGLADKIIGLVATTMMACGARSKRRRLS